jgi:membrane protein
MRRWLRNIWKRLWEWGNRVRIRLFQFTFVRFAYNVAQTMGRDYVGIMAAGVSYYTFLSLFPLVIGLISILGFLLPSESIYEIIFTFLEQNIPTSTEVLETNIRRIVELRGPLGLISIAGLFFAGTAVFSAVSVTVNRAWGLFPRSFFIRKPQEIAMILSIGLIIILLLGLSTGLSLLGNLDLPAFGIFEAILPRALSFVLITAIFLLLYKFTPSAPVRWRDIWRGALLGAIMFQAALFGFAFFIQNFSSYSLIYGSLTSIVVILIWIYISSFILILCAEINAVYYQMFTQKGE